MNNKHSLVPTDSVSEAVAEYFDEGQEVVSYYSRKQAIEDGLLIDVGAIGHEVGFSYPIAVTSSAWAAVVEVPGVVEESEETRLRVMLYSLRRAVQSLRQTAVVFTVRVFDGVSWEMVALKAEVWPEDGGQVITIMLLGEE